MYLEKLLTKQQDNPLRFLGTLAFRLGKDHFCLGQGKVGLAFISFGLILAFY